MVGFMKVCIDGFPGPVQVRVYRVRGPQGGILIR